MKSAVVPETGRIVSQEVAKPDGALQITIAGFAILTLVLFAIVGALFPPILVLLAVLVAVVWLAAAFIGLLRRL